MVETGTIGFELVSPIVTEFSLSLNSFAFLQQVHALGLGYSINVCAVSSKLVYRDKCHLGSCGQSYP